MKNKLHRLAINMGWYKDITKGLPLNICKTVFGVYFFEGVYVPRQLGELFSEIYNWGINDAQPDGFDVELDWERRTNI